MSPLVSIITPCYNGEAYVARFLDSVLNQTYDRIELIFVNDGSTDRTEEIVFSYKDAFERKNIRFVYLWQKNGGQSSALNRGLKVFEGDYLAWPDSDDILYPESIGRRVKYLEAHPELGLVRCRSELVLDTVPLKRIALVGEDILAAESNKVCEDIIRGKINVMPGSWLVRSRALLDVLPEREIIAPRGIGQNFQLLLPLTYRYECGYMPDILFSYVVRPDSHSHRRRSLEQMLQYWDIARDTLQKIVRNMKIEDEAYYLDTVIPERYHRWMAETAAQYRNRRIFREHARQLSEMTGEDNGLNGLWFRYSLCGRAVHKLKRICKR